MSKDSKSRFFLAFALSLLAIVLIGFSPTLYLRPFFEPPAIPLYLYLHGLIVTVWFLWFALQASLVAASRIDTHKRAGMGGISIAIALVILGVYTILKFPSRFAKDGGNVNADMPVLSAIVWADLGMLLMFSVFVVFAVVNRDSRQIHKRFMLFASLSIITPAIDRISRWQIISGVDAAVVTAVVVILLLATPIAYEGIVVRRLHAVTIWSAISLFLVVTLLGAGVAASDWGRNWIIWLANDL